MMKTLDDFDKDQGTFYPRGHTVVAFNSYHRAASVAMGLKARSSTFADTVLATPQQMIDFVQSHTGRNGQASQIDSSLPTLLHYLDLARGGAYFLVIRTPGGEAAAAVARAIEYVPHLLAQRYQLLAIEDMA